MLTVRKGITSCNTGNEAMLKLCSFLQCVAHVEAFIDFGEDENIEEGILDQGKSPDSHMTMLSITRQSCDTQHGHVTIM